MKPADPSPGIEELRACFKDLESHEDKVSQQARRAIVLYAQVHPQIGNGDLKTAIEKLSFSEEEVMRNSFFCQAHDLQKPLYKSMAQAMMKGDLLHWQKKHKNGLAYIAENYGLDLSAGPFTVAGEGRQLTLTSPDKITQILDAGPAERGVPLASKRDIKKALKEGLQPMPKKTHGDPKDKSTER